MSFVFSYREKCTASRAPTKQEWMVVLPLQYLRRSSCHRVEFKIACWLIREPFKIIMVSVKCLKLTQEKYHTVLPTKYISQLAWFA